MNTVDHTKTIIELADVSFSYGETEVLKDINLSIHKGDYIALVGANGAGKTTLLKIMLGLLKPTGGKVLLFGKEISKAELYKIGYVPQKGFSMDSNFPATVMEVVLMGRYGKRGLLNRITEEDRTAAEEALVQVGMSEYKDRLIGDLSGGQQQRVFIARALSAHPEILFLDEPTASVEQKTREEFYALIRSLNQDFNLTVVLVSHDVDIFVKEAMHIVCIDKTLTCNSTPEEFLKEIDERDLGKNVDKISLHHHFNIKHDAR